MGQSSSFPQSIDAFLTLRDIARAIIKRGRTIVQLTIVATCCGILVAFLQPPVYDGRSELLLKRTSLSTDGEIMDTLGNMPGPSTNFRQINQEAEIKTEMVMIQSRDLIVEVIDELGLTREQFENINDYRKYVRMAFSGFKNMLYFTLNELKYLVRLSKRPSAEEKALKEREHLIDAVLKALVVEQIPESDVIGVGFRCSDPFLSQKFSQSVCRRAIIWHDKIRGQSDENLSFYQDMVAKASEELSDADKKLSAARKDFDLIGAEENKGLLIKFKLEAVERLNGVKQRRAALEAGVSELHKNLKKIPENIMLSKTSATNPAWKDIAEKLADLEMMKIQASTNYAEEGKKMKDINTSIEKAKSYLSSIPSQIDVSSVSGINETHKTLYQSLLVKMAELSAADAEGKQIETSIEEFDKKLVDLNDQVFRVKSIEREVSSAETAYDLYLKNAELARVKSEKRKAPLANLVILENAGLPLKAVKPRKALYILLAFAGSLMLGTVWSIAKELNDTTYMNKEELERDLGVHSLGSIRFFDQRKY